MLDNRIQTYTERATRLELQTLDAKRTRVLAYLTPAIVGVFGHLSNVFYNIVA